MRIDENAVVLDTNVVLDWLVFDDVRSRALGQALLDRRVCWWVCPAIVAEIDAVLARPFPARWEDARKQALTRDWQALARHAADPPVGIAPRLRCRDADDQKFVDFALARGARVLFSRDRSLLALAGTARRLGLTITTPAGWSPPA